eukprot:CAMPEP_0119010930 /NCGR_PEP_ID=MMETSP1176-20130426/5349_1 /TAXON_ID=265551 /ORGANISM="Synedropsis recta cf, Strain CCMP1620" /LENGTH=195 /DNA_ID=CAMNT_0006963679 /DNA_START=160 /DNA_END=747 /DNA_ORIENTATION=+
MGFAILPFAYHASSLPDTTDVVACEANFSISVGVFLLALGASEFVVYLVCKLMAWYANDAFYSQSLEWIHNAECGEDDTPHELISQHLEKCEYEPSEAAESCCPICLVDYDQGELVSHGKCHHEFHEQCLVQWLAKHTSCPCCRDCIVTTSPNAKQMEDDAPVAAAHHGGLLHFANWVAYPDASGSDPSLFLFMV